MSLICTAKKCEFGGCITGDSYLSCWLCNNCSHIITKNIGLTWSCIACREIESEMRTFMKQTRNGFLDVRKQFSALNEQFLTFETQFLGLKLLNESPRRKIPNNNPMGVKLLGTPASYAIHSDTFLTPNTSSPTVVPVEVIHSPSQWNRQGVLHPPSLGNLQVPVAPAPRPLTGVAPVLRSSGLSLRAVSPRKALFVSRLMPDATVDDVRSHLSNHLKVAPNELAVFKFNFKHKRSISSFKIVIPESYFEKALDPSAWPEHSIIHEFLAKDHLNPNYADPAPKT
ncbi:hypothetical protein KR067_000410 [Drosophila pandora]|nr:hypothetical protein KR067_000410 [Drosophila pandora]